MKAMNWFDVDKSGLAKLIEDRGMAPLVFELIQNAIDTDATRVDVQIDPVPGRPLIGLVVKDDNPRGFSNLAHAYTLFAESEKKGDPTKRGRFNLGEKLVLALCDEACVMSTTGTVSFNRDGTRTHTKRDKTERGSVFAGHVRAKRAELTDTLRAVRTMLPPGNVEVFINGELLEARTPIASDSVTLPTVIADAEGRLVRTARKTIVRVHEVRPGEKPTLYEMGIPVVELPGDRYHVDVQQKVPLNMDRDNVPESYLRAVRAVVLNATHALLDKETAAEAWVTDALQHKDVSDVAVDAAMTKRFGDKRATRDPNDPEAGNRLVAQGYTLVHGGSLPAGAWENVRRAGAIQSAGKISPTPRPYSDDPNATPVEIVEPNDDQRFLAEVVRDFARAALPSSKLPGSSVVVRFVRAQGAAWTACYGAGRLDYNLAALGAQYPRGAVLAEVLDLMLHELAHAFEGNHLDERYHEACTRLGANLTVWCMPRNPGAVRLEALERITLKR